MELTPFDLERIETWAADFADAPAFSTLSAPEKEAAIPLASEFLRAACAAESAAPDSVGEAGFRAALLERIPALDLPEEVRARAPELLALFLESLQAQGRNPGGGPFVRALRSLHERRERRRLHRTRRASRHAVARARHGFDDDAARRLRVTDANHENLAR